MLRIAGRHGQFIINQNDIYVGTSLLEYGEYCEVEWKFFSRFLKEGAIVIDAGANMGALAVPMARAVGPSGKVYAFEPQPLILACLKATAQLNNLPQLIAMPQGLGEEPDTLETALPDYEAFDSFAGLSLLGGGKGLVAEIVRMDDIFKDDRLDFIKMDIEGMEVAALKGAAATFKKHQPVLYIENDKVEQSAALIALLQGWGYRMWWHTTPMYNPDNFRGVATNIYQLENGQSVHNINMICLPPSRPELEALIPSTLIRVTGPEHTLREPQGVRNSFA